MAARNVWLQVLRQFLKISTRIIICNSNEFKKTIVEEQIRAKYPTDINKIVFEYIKKIVIEAGGTVQDIIKMDLYFSDKSDRSIVNPEWVKMFPDPNKRPARHAQIAELPKDCCLQVTLTAVIET